MLFSHRKNQKRNRNSSRLAQKKRNLKALESLEGRRLLSADGWVATGFGNGYVQTDSEGSVYLASMVESPDTDNDLVLAKYSADGTREWTREFVVAGRDNVSNLAIDESGQSLYIVGSYFDVNPFQPDLSSVGNLDLFVAKLSTVDGSVQWHRSWGTPAHEFANGIAVSNGSVYVAGRVGPDPDGIDFDGTIVAGQNRDDSPAFILKIDAESINGQVVWAKQSNGSANPVDIAVTHSASNETLVTIGGIVANDVDFDAVGLSTSERSHFVAQLIDYGNNASFTWARSFRTDWDFYAITSDATGVYATGYLRLMNGGQVDFGPGFSLEAREDGDAYLLRLNHDGSTEWVNQIGGAGRQDTVSGLTTDGAGNQLLVTGYFQETAEFGSGIALTSHGEFDGFAAAYNISDGSLRSLRRIGGSSSDYLPAISYHAGWIYAAGRSDSPYAEFPVSAIGKSEDAFVDFRAEPSGRFLTKFKLDGPRFMEITEPVYGTSANVGGAI
ncbi:MAG: SBBP repeat-containing protein, partial [bacterium]|nr:SBBP repeat-containing protein [bacterium]